MAAAARLQRFAEGEQFVQLRADGVGVVGHVGVHQTRGVALLAAGQAPDEGRSRESYSSSPASCSITCGPLRPTRASRVTTVAAQPGGDGHATEAADGTGDHTDYRLVVAQLDDGRLISAMAAVPGWLPADVRRRFPAGARRGSGCRCGCLRQPVPVRRRSSRRRLRPCCRPGRRFDGGDHRRLAVNGALGDHHAVVGLGDDALLRQPGRGDAIERIEQFAETALVQQCAGTLAGTEFDEAARLE